MVPLMGDAVDSRRRFDKQRFESYKREKITDSFFGKAYMQNCAKSTPQGKRESN